MSIEWFRDLVICILGLGATVAVIVLAVIAILFYCKIIPALNSLKKASKTVEEISSCVEAEVVRPLSQMAAFVQGLRQAAGLFSRFTKKKGDNCDE